MFQHLAFAAQITVLRKVLTCVNFTAAMTLNAQVAKSGNENNASLLRRFTKRVQGAGVQQEVRKRRYHQRRLSKQVKKENKLEKLRRAERIKWLVKLGEISDRK